jgi:hypothetical protein
VKGGAYRDDNPAASVQGSTTRWASRTKKRVHSSHRNGASVAGSGSSSASAKYVRLPRPDTATSFIKAMPVGTATRKDRYGGVGGLYDLQKGSASVRENLFAPGHLGRFGTLEVGGPAPAN